MSYTLYLSPVSLYSPTPLILAIHRTFRSNYAGCINLANFKYGMTLDGPIQVPPIPSIPCSSGSTSAMSLGDGQAPNQDVNDVPEHSEYDFRFSKAPWNPAHAIRQLIAFGVSPTLHAQFEAHCAIETLKCTGTSFSDIRAQGVAKVMKRQRNLVFKRLVQSGILSCPIRPYPIQSNPTL